MGKLIPAAVIEHFTFSQKIKEIRRNIRQSFKDPCTKTDAYIAIPETSVKCRTDMIIDFG